MARGKLLFLPFINRLTRDKGGVGKTVSKEGKGGGKIISKIKIIAMALNLDFVRQDYAMLGPCERGTMKLLA